MKPALFTSFKGYKWSNFARDVMSGLLVAIIALPLSIALGIQSGATLQQGLITAIIAGFFISALGGSHVQIGGPTAAFVSIIVGYIGSIGMLGLHVATIMAGVIMILMGIFKIGGLVRYIPYPIVIGFTSGIGVTLLVGQLADFTGVNMTAGFSLFGDSPAFLHSEFVNKLGNIIVNSASISVPTLTIGIMTLCIMILLPRINKKIPAAFVAIIVSTLIVALPQMIGMTGETGVATIGSLYPDAKAEFILPEWSEFSSLNFGKLIMPAIVIAFLGSVESLLSATVADNLTGKKHDSNAELVGQGVANIASACCGGLPATGAIARTAANIQNGGGSPIAGITHSLVLLLMFFVLMPVVKFVPMASLAAVLIVVSVNMANFKLFAKLTTFNKRDLAILLSTFAMTVYKDLVYGVITGLIVTMIVLSVDIFKRCHIEETVEGECEAKIYRVKPMANLTFLSTPKLVKMCENQADADSIIIDVSSTTRSDLSTMEKIVKLEKSLAMRQKKLSLHGANDYVARQYEKMRQI